jgi:hypothetical protein
LAAAVKAWRAKAGGGYPDEWYDAEKDVDGSIIAGCEGCERVILEGERYGWGEDGCYVCADCLAEEQRAIPTGDYAVHDLYKTGDAAAPASIKDRNGDVALGMCRRCGRAEVELDEPCSTFPTPASD